MKIYIDMEIVIVILLCAILLIFNWIIASQNESIEKKIDDLSSKIDYIKSKTEDVPESYYSLYNKIIYTLNAVDKLNCNVEKLNKKNNETKID